MRRESRTSVVRRKGISSPRHISGPLRATATPKTHQKPTWPPTVTRVPSDCDRVAAVRDGGEEDWPTAGRIKSHAPPLRPMLHRRERLCHAAHSNRRYDALTRSRLKPGPMQIIESPVMRYKADITAGALKLPESRLIADLLLRRVDRPLQALLPCRAPARSIHQGRWCPIWRPLEIPSRDSATPKKIGHQKM